MQARPIPWCPQAQSGAANAQDENYRRDDQIALIAVVNTASTKVLRPGPQLRRRAHGRRPHSRWDGGNRAPLDKGQTTANGCGAYDGNIVHSSDNTPRQIGRIRGPPQRAAQTRAGPSQERSVQTRFTVVVFARDFAHDQNVP